VVGVLCVLMGFAAAAQAATFTVGSNLDTGGCASPPNGNTCTLRQLVNSVPAGSTIIVPATTYNLTAGELSITENMTIVGAGVRTTRIDQQTAAANARVFDVQPGVTATISGLSMSFGKADSTSTGGAVGGDILNQGTLALSEDLIASGQTTGGSGAGISNQRGATLTVTHSLIENNQSLASNGVGGLAGGIENSTTRFTAAHLMIDNSTIFNNSAAAGGGGVVSDCFGPCSSTATITNSTITSNQGGTAATNAGGLLATAGTISVLNSILAANTVSSGTPSNCSGGALITSLGNNIESATDCGFTTTGDHQNTDPGFLSGISDFGGSTDTFALKATSPAVDAIPPGSPGCSGSDQRGISRPQGSGCDIGSFELFQPVEGQSFMTVVGAVSGSSVSIDWGDGTSTPATPAATTGQVTGTHTYAEEGVYHGVINYRNSDGTPQQFPFDVKVQDAPLNSAPIPVAAGAGASFTGPVATFTDADPAGTASDYSASINWGDGSVSGGTVTPTSGGFQVAGTHTYAVGGTFTTSISISDAGGASTVVHGTATIASASSPGSVSTGAPSVTATGAAFSGSANPNGLPTNAFFQYGLDPKYNGGGPVVYTGSTPARAVGSDFASHIVLASVSGLVPNALYHVRLVATNSAGTTLGPDVTFTTAAAPAPGSPTLGKTFNISLVSGIVLVEVHGVFIPLTELTQIPDNTVINALHGAITLTTAASSQSAAHDAAAKRKKHKTPTQKGTFGGAIFRISQTTAGAGKGLVTLAIVEGAFKGAPSYSLCTKHKAADPTATAASISTLQLLHASAHGKFRTKGRYSAATVLGTIWTVADRCDGTLTHDITDSVVVNDFVHHKTIVLHAGQSYLASAPKHK
jgi:hypothetical protein